MTNREARHALESGKVYVADMPTADPGREIEPDAVSIRANAPRIRIGMDPAIVYRDDHLAVAIKPARLLSVPAPGRRGERTLLGELARALGGAHVVHRLDEDTSGLMLVARTEPCQLALKDLLYVHAVERGYLALVRGRLTPGEHTVRNILVRDRGDGKRGSGDAADPTARPAVTRIHLVTHVSADISLVEARLETGRTHQVRITLAELGHPVLGDRLYGRPGPTPPRLALHSARLAFRHPMTGEQLRFEAPLPDDLERFRREASAGQRQHRQRRRR